MKRYQMIVFDWDGTLMDSIDRIVSCVENIARIAGFPHPDSNEIKNRIGLDLRVCLGQLFSVDETSPEMDELVVLYQRQFFYDNPVEMQLLPGVEDMLNQLHDDGYRLAIATGKSRIGLDRVLQEFELTDMFEFAMVAEETAGKPNPEMLLQIARRSGVAREEMLMLGDSQLDLNMAKNGGVDAVGVLSGVNGRDKLNACKPRAILNVASELPEWLSFG